MNQPTDRQTDAQLPRLTANLPGIGGRVKEHADDFRVVELPLHQPLARGRYAYVLVTKQGLTTPAAVQRLARFMGMPAAHVGYAGLKDAQAVTTQWMSLPDADIGRLRRFRNPQMCIEDVRWGNSKLLAGELAGNQFTVRIRGVGKAQVPAARAVLDVLLRTGAPNYFGLQRFGSRFDNHMLGLALLRGDLDEFVALFLGRPEQTDNAPVAMARRAFDAGRYADSMRRWPVSFFEQRRALGAFMKRRRPEAAVSAIEDRLKRLYVSAFQSAIFNENVAARVNDIGRLWDGDLAIEHATGKVAPIDNVAQAQAMADRFELSPTGLMPGTRAPLATGKEGRVEHDLLGRFEVTPELFERYRRLEVFGTRRPLRFSIAGAKLSAGKDNHGSYIELAFTAPAGSYATVVLDEICK